MNASVRHVRYAELVAKRKACHLCRNLTNPSVVEGGRFDSEHVGPWSRWQGNLAAPLVVVGQDWGDKAYFVGQQGWERPGNPTNRILRDLLELIGFSIPPPGPSGEPQAVFLTNAILCLKEGGLQGPVSAEWFANCRPFLRAQIDVIKPTVVVGLGQRAFENILMSFDLRPPPFRAAVEDCTGTLLPQGSRAFAAYHCGSRILNTHRRLPAQRRDWQRIGDALRRSRGAG